MSLTAGLERLTERLGRQADLTARLLQALPAGAAGIGEAAVASTRVHLLVVGRPGVVQVLKDADAGRAFYGRSRPGQILHIDVFHADGEVDHRLVARNLARAARIFARDAGAYRIAGLPVEQLPDYVDLQTGTGGGRASGSLIYGRRASLRLAHRNHVHLAIGLPRSLWGFAIYAVAAAEEAILAAGLELRRVDHVELVDGTGGRPLDLSDYETASDSLLREEGRGSRAGHGGGRAAAGAGGGPSPAVTGGGAPGPGHGHAGYGGEPPRGTGWGEGPGGWSGRWREVPLPSSDRSRPPGAGGRPGARGDGARATGWGPGRGGGNPLPRGPAGEPGAGAGGPGAGQGSPGAPRAAGDAGAGDGGAPDPLAAPGAAAAPAAGTLSEAERERLLTQGLGLLRETGYDLGLALLERLAGGAGWRELQLPGAGYEDIRRWLAELRQRGLLAREGERYLLTATGWRLLALLRQEPAVVRMALRRLLRQRPRRQDPRPGHGRPLVYDDERGRQANRRVVRPWQAGGRGDGVAVAESVLAALARHGLPLRVTAADLRQYRRLRRHPVDVCLLLDASASMAGSRIRAAKDLAQQLLVSTRDRVAVITFQERAVQVQVPLTRNTVRVERGLSQIQPYGLTPLAQGLEMALAFLQQARARNPLLVLITDGIPTVPYRTANPLEDAVQVARQLGDGRYGRVAFTCIGLQPNERYLRELVQAAGGRLYVVDELERDTLVAIVHRERSQHKDRIRAQ